MAVIGTQTGNYEDAVQALAQYVNLDYPVEAWYDLEDAYAGLRYLTPHTDFVGVPLTGPAPLAVAFTDLSTVGAP